MYTRCPKCGHAPLPLDQALPAACGNCGVVLEKVRQLAEVTKARQAPHRAFNGQAVQPARQAFAAANEPGNGRRRGYAGLRSVFWRVPERIDSTRFCGRVALLAGFTVWGWLLMRMDYRTGEMGSSFIHGPLLVFHEAGHVCFMILGEWMSILGGTLGQLLMPLLLGGALLLKNRDPFGAAIGLWFFGVSVLDVAPYLYDALEPQLVLLGGRTAEEGGHDWIYLLSSIGLLAKAQILGGLVHKAGVLLVVGALAWAGWVLRLQYPRIAGPVMHE